MPLDVERSWDTCHLSFKKLSFKKHTFIHLWKERKGVVVEGESECVCVCEDRQIAELIG